MNAPASHAPPAFLQLERLVLSMPMAQTLGLKFTRIAPGDVEVEILVQEAFTFRPGQLQATPVFAIGDFAAVAAAGTTLPPGWINATVDATLKLVAPARRAGSTRRWTPPSSSWRRRKGSPCGRVAG